MASSPGRLVDQPTVPALRQHGCYHSLCQRLEDAHGPKPEPILALADAAGVKATKLPAQAAAVELWPVLLAEALNQGRLKAVVSRILADESKRGHHATIRALAEMDLAAEMEAYARSIRTQLRRAMAEQYVDLSALPDRPRGRGPAGPPEEDDDLAFAAGWESLPEVEGRYQAAGKHEGQAEPVPRVRDRLMTVRRCLLLGEPGSGKTWTLTRLLLAHAEAWLAAPEAARDDLPLPVWVPLRNFRGRAEAGEPQSLRDYMQAQLGPLAPLWDDLLALGRLVPLLDAFNEMPRSSPTGSNLVLDVERELRRLPRFVLSCRLRDYGNELGGMEGLELLRLQDLDPPKMLAVIRARFKDYRAADLWAKMGGSDDLLRAWDLVLAQGDDFVRRFWVRDGLRWEDFKKRSVGTDHEARSAWSKIHQGARLIPLARNPFLLGNLCRLFRDTGRLPDSRAGLFADLTQALLQNEIDRCTKIGRPWPTSARDEVISALTDVAMAMQAAKETVIGRSEAEAAIKHGNATWLLNTALDARLLREDGAQVAFEHQLFQEYFAARQLWEDLEAGRSPAAYFLAGEGWWDPHFWRETWVILGELLGDGPAGPNRVARWLADTSPEVALEVVLRSGAGFEPEAVEPDTRQLLVASAQTKTEEQHPYGRAAAYRVLGRLNADDRKGVGLLPPGPDDVSLPDIDWVEIPGGIFTYQKGEKGAREVTLPAFKMARYPVTWAQFQAFVEAPDGYGHAGWWKGLEKRSDQPAQASWPISNHPRESVDWGEAVAFGRWLTAHLRAAGQLAANEEARLPTEEEWERAARGTNCREFPWGDGYQPDQANINETWGYDRVGPYHLGRTSAVGIYGDGATPSPENIHDLAGNVWEWCLDLQGGASSSEAARVVRGGSWLNVLLVARAACRDWPLPYLRDDNQGFRLVVSSPISPDALASGAA